MTLARRLVRALTLAALLPGCGVTYLERNAPGIADIRTPPSPAIPTESRPPAPDRSVERPSDPGGHLVIVSYGVFGGVGGAGGGGQGERFAYGLGPEVSIAKGTTVSSHPEGFPFPVMEWGYGLNLGWTALTGSRRSVGPLYAEAEIRSSFFAVGVGWVWAPVEPTHGPQATLSFGPLYLRGTHEIDLGTQFHIGLLLKGYSAWAWSR